MIKRRFSQRALAYGLSAVLTLAAVLVSLYRPDTRARLGDGALQQAHEEPFSWTGYRAREWREEAQLFLLDEARSGGAATLSLGSAENAPELPTAVEALFLLILQDARQDGVLAVECGVLRGEWEGLAVEEEYDVFTYRDAERVGRIYASAQSGTIARAEWASKDTQHFAERLFSMVESYNALAQAEKDTVTADEGGRGTRQFLWTSACDVLGLEFWRYLNGTEAALLLGQAGLSSQAADAAAFPAEAQSDGNGEANYAIAGDSLSAEAPQFSGENAVQSASDAFLILGEWENALDARDMPIVFVDAENRYEVHLKAQDGALVFALLPAI